ncbi:hypothetical protein [Aeoliella mucimassa]|uniref:Uncharacterized protein n=1 Tax=Aeoliella mucimassa TaxID=2527972 RepID=A0A518ARV2_9BACT|nr:hypothetical protein [Aeoliella mucimassa]QDU57438.1 hypothetical protein Pan181_36540 [Aeoliella mucimassa]
MLIPTSKSLKTGRPGTVYIAVLGVTLTVAVLASVAVSIVRIERRVDASHDAMRTSHWLARTASESAIIHVTQDPQWRTSLESGDESTHLELDGGTYFWRVIDPDGDFDDDLRDCIWIEGIGQVGEALSVEKVRLMPTGTPLSCLEVAMLVDDSFGLSSGSYWVHTIIRTNQTVASNDDVAVGTGSREIDGDAEAADYASGNVTGTKTSRVAQRELPNDDYLTYYQSAGTWIPLDSLESDGINYEMNDKVLSPNANPYGVPNPEGIYLIDCQGKNVEINYCRIVGTLVLINPGSQSAIPVSSSLEPAVPNYPALLVDGDFALAVSDYWYSGLYEDYRRINYNPPGTPYMGVDDYDYNDYYPAGIFGLVYVSGDLHVTGNTLISGGLICGDFSISSSKTLEVNYDSVYWDNPPPGFAKDDPMQVIPASWQRGTY